MRELICNVEGIPVHTRVFSVDEPGHGGACHKYIISFENPKVNNHYALNFQNGPIEQGVNGIMHEDLLAILIDRLEGFQKGPYACEENGLALDACKEALGHLHTRTKKRIARNVEGTHTV